MILGFICSDWLSWNDDANHLFLANKGADSYLEARESL